MKVFPKSSFRKFCNLKFDTITRMERRLFDGCFDFAGQDRWIGESGKYYILVVFRGGVVSVGRSEYSTDLHHKLKPIGKPDNLAGTSLEEIMHGLGWTCDDDQIWDI